MKKLTLKETLDVIERINKSKEFECFIDSGKVIVQTRVITIIPWTQN